MDCKASCESHKRSGSPVPAGHPLFRQGSDEGILSGGGQCYKLTVMGRLLARTFAPAVRGALEPGAARYIKTGRYINSDRYTKTMNKLSSQQWHEIGRRIFTSWGAPDDIADGVARSLVESDLAGVSSHGVLRIPSYYGFWEKGWLNLTGRAQIIRESPATLNVDGNWGFGQPAMHQALDWAMAKSRTQGIAGVGLVRSSHIGRLGEYAEKAAEAGVMALVTASGGPGGGLVVPYGGAERVLCTNPIAAGVRPASARRSSWILPRRWWRPGSWRGPPTQPRKSRKAGHWIPQVSPPPPSRHFWMAEAYCLSADTRGTRLPCSSNSSVAELRAPAFPSAPTIFPSTDWAGMPVSPS